MRCTHNDFSLGMGEQGPEQVGVSPPWSPLCFYPPALLVEEMRSLDEVHCFQSEALAPAVQVPVLVCPASLVVLGLVVVLR